MGSRPLRALLFLLCLSLGAAQPAGVITSPSLTANFDYKIKNSNRVKTPRNPPPGLSLSPSVLSLSTVHLCPVSKECTPCIRVQIAMNTSGFPKLHGLEVQILFTQTNYFKKFQIINRNKTTVENTWKVQYDFCEGDMRSGSVHVYLLTIPDYNLKVNQQHVIRQEDSGPQFSHTLNETKREINVSVPFGPELNARLCYQLQNLVCHELKNHSFQRINTSLSLSSSLKYEYLLPCLCIEVYYRHPDSKRQRICPFAENPKAYGADFWKSARFEDESSSHTDQMEMAFGSLCPLKPSVSLCQKQINLLSSACEDIPNSTALESKSSYRIDKVDKKSRLYFKSYRIDKVDKNPGLCFKFAFGNNSHVECPHTTDTYWAVTSRVQLLHLVLTFTFKIRIPASFSATTCRKSDDGQCDSASAQPVYTITSPGDSTPGKLDLILPFQVRESCVLVWRSDVSFATKELICPDFSRRRIGLVAVGLLAGICLVIAAVLLNYHNIRKIMRAPLLRRTVLLVYSSDSEQYKIAICAFADFLRTSLGCDVILDLWDVGHVTQIGILPWLYSKRELVEREKGKVIVVWTQYSSKIYELWKSTNMSSSCRRDPHNLFGAAMTCLQSDMKKLKGKERLQDYILVYFDGLCEKQDIPASLRSIPQYRLFKELHGLVNELHHTTQAPPCWIKAAAKFLVRKLIKSEKSTSLQGRLELCRLQKQGCYGWPKEIAETKLETCIY